jgi:hypothetical protein
MGAPRFLSLLLLMAFAGGCALAPLSPLLGASEVFESKAKESAEESSEDSESSFLEDGKDSSCLSGRGWEVPPRIHRLESTIAGTVADRAKTRHQARAPPLS